jgi:hypothetical protein
VNRFSVLIGGGGIAQSDTELGHGADGRRRAFVQSAPGHTPTGALMDRIVPSDRRVVPYRAVGHRDRRSGSDVRTS